jgi:hypothetical protein
LTGREIFSEHIHWQQRMKIARMYMYVYIFRRTVTAHSAEKCMDEDELQDAVEVSALL